MQVSQSVNQETGKGFMEKSNIFILPYWPPKDLLSILFPILTLIDHVSCFLIIISSYALCLSVSLENPTLSGSGSTSFPMAPASPQLDSEGSGLPSDLGAQVGLPHEGCSTTCGPGEGAGPAQLGSPPATCDLTQRRQLGSP